MRTSGLLCKWSEESEDSEESGESGEEGGYSGVVLMVRCWQFQFRTIGNFNILGSICFFLFVGKRRLIVHIHLAQKAYLHISILSFVSKYNFCKG